MAKLPTESLTESEMDTWVGIIEMSGAEHLGRAHEMLHAAIVEVRAHRAMVKRLEELATRFDVFTPPDGDMIQKSQAAHDIRSAMKGG